MVIFPLELDLGVTKSCIFERHCGRFISHKDPLINIHKCKSAPNKTHSPYEFALNIEFQSTKNDIWDLKRPNAI